MSIMNNISNTSFNISALVQLPFNPWTYISIFSLNIFLLATCFNGFVLILFARNANLRTPFTIYITNLYIANLINQIYQQPLTIATHLYSAKYLGRAFCNTYLYGSYVIHSAVFNAHFAITLNRIWAVTSPLTYRLYHNKKFAIVICVMFWIYVHVVMLPGLITNALYYKVPLKMGCYIDKKRKPLLTWSIIEQVMLYDVPLSFLILAYPVICFAEVRRRARRTRLVQQGPGNEGSITGAPPGPSSMASRPIIGESRSDTSPSKAFTVLTILTCNNGVFLTPLTVGYNLSTALSAGVEFPVWLTQQWLSQLYIVTPMLFYAQAVADPILFTLALKDLRSAAFSTLSNAYRSLKFK